MACNEIMDPNNHQYQPNDVDAKIAAEHHVAGNYLTYDPAVYKQRATLQTQFRSYLRAFQHLQHPMLLLSSILIASIFLVGGVTLAAVKMHNHKSSSQAIPSESMAKNAGSPDSTPYVKAVAGSSDDSSDDGSDSGDDPYSDEDAVDGEQDYTDNSSDSGSSDDGASSDDNDSDATDGAFDTTFDNTFDESDVNDIPYLNNSSSATTSVANAAGSGAPAASVKKILVFVEENRSLAQMKANMPYAFKLAQKYGYATNYTGIRHPSLPNYIAMAGGSTYGISNDAGPGSNGVSGASVFGRAVSAGKSVRVYADGMPSNCATSDGGSNYRVKHNPWAYFKNERAQCQKYDVPASKFASAASTGTLPNLGFIVPNMCHDAHDCSLLTADNWFKAQMAHVFAGPDWKSGKLAVVLTADEDDNHSGNKVLTVVIHPSQHGHVVSKGLNHYSLSRLMSQVTATGALKEGQSAPSMSAAFGLPL